MVTNVLVYTFEDEAGVARRLSVADAKSDIDAPAAKLAAQNIVDSGIFSVKGKFVQSIKAQIVKTDTTDLYNM